MRDECYTFAILEDENTLFFKRKRKEKKRKGQLRTEQTEGTQVAHTQFLRTIIHAWPTSLYLKVNLFLSTSPARSLDKVIDAGAQQPAPLAAVVAHSLPLILLHPPSLAACSSSAPASSPGAPLH
jgi:hypothetical protein